MLASALFAMGLIQKSGPPLPAFTSAVFQDAVRAAEKSLEASDFVAAQRDVALLPKRNFTLGVDDKNLPAAERDAVRAACAQAKLNWGSTGALASTAPDIRITFEPSLGADPKIGGPANVALFFDDGAGHPRLTASLGLHRDSPLRDMTSSDVLNDVRYAIGAYLGLATHPFPRYLMDPLTQTDDVRQIWPVEHKAAVSALNLSDQLRSATVSHLSIGISGKPSAVIGPPKFSGEALQGDDVEVAVQLTNAGEGTLVIDAIGDCACVVPESAPDLDAGGKGTLRVKIDTRNLAGEVDRSVIVLTNDPEHLMYTSDVHLSVSPRYRILMPGGETWVLDRTHTTGEAYLVFPAGVNPKLIDARIVGMDGGRVTYEPWSGTMADPILNEPAKSRHGYHLHVVLPDTLLPGRYPVSLSIYTNDPELPSFNQTINLQRGIVALPGELLLDVGKKAKSLTVLLSRPGRPFGVLSSESTIKSVHVAAHPGRQPGEVKLDVTYDGTAPKGDLDGAITVKTDDPSQPTVKIRIVGSVQ